MNKDILKLKDTDLYSLSMFTLYKLRDVPEYSSLSELAYILDKQNLLKLCEYFGGTTIKIPTIRELHLIMQVLLLYQYVNIEHIPYSKSVDLIGFESKNLREIKTIYTKLCKILEDFNIKARS